MTRLITQIDRSKRVICDASEAVDNDELEVFEDSTGRLTFVRHVYDGDSANVVSSEVIVIGGDDPVQFPITRVDRSGVTLHQGKRGHPPIRSSSDIDLEAIELLWRDACDRDVLIGRDVSGRLHALCIGGAEPEFPCVCRDAGTILYLGN